MSAKRWTDAEIRRAVAEGGSIGAAWRLLGGPGKCPGGFRERATALGAEPTESRYAALVAACKGGISFQALCDRLDLSPVKCRRLLDAARADGVRLANAHGTIDLDWAHPSDQVRPTGIAPTVGEVQRIAVMSDSHAGSRYALRAQLRDFVQYAHDQGVTEILHCGDILEGQYRHARFELTHSGLDAQARDVLETWPRIDGLTYHCITGNHDQTHADASGLDVGEDLVRRFRNVGRTDLHYYGARGAFINLRGVVIHMWHPIKPPAYAVSYHLQKQVESYSSVKPQILLTGHWHRYCHVNTRGVEAFAVPCLQGGEGQFGKALGGSPSIGGLILEWQCTAEGTIRDFAVRPRRYHERETIVDVRNRLDSIEIPPTIAQVRVIECSE